MRILLIASLLATSCASLAAAPKPSDFRLEAGYTLDVFQADVEGARSLAHSPTGTVFVGTRAKQVYAIFGGKKIVIADQLDCPNGIAFSDGSLYVGETKQIIKFEGIEEGLKKNPAGPFKSTVVFKGLPEDGGHDWRYMAFAPDRTLYLAVGAPCNICDREKDEPRFSTILRFPKLDGTAPEIYAKGIRNSVGFDWNPKTKALWFTENGRDWLGDDSPDDELNSAEKSGQHFGYPFCHAGTTLDPKYGKSRSCAEFIPPKALLGAHVAALGMRFLDENTALIALHGSWNRSTPSGYKVVKVTLGPKGPRITPFVEGFRMLDGKVIGRPVDVDVQPDGSILVSDDKANTIYRITRTKQ